MGCFYGNRYFIYFWSSQYCIMDRKKKKLEAGKTAAAIEQNRKMLRDRFIIRTKEIINRIGGQELQEMIPPIYIEKLYQCRYPSLKAKAAPGSEVSKSLAVKFHKLMHQMMEGVNLTIHNGNEIPLTWYLSEGQTLIDGISTLDAGDDPRYLAIKKYLEPFQEGTKIHQFIQEQLIDLVVDTCRFLSDYNDRIYTADVSMTPYFAAFNPTSDIIIHAHKPVMEKVQTSNGTRDAIRLGWLNADFKWQHYNVKPSLLGFKVPGIEIPLEIYITKHALQRLKERINITPGIMHEILLLIFMQKKIAHRWQGHESHVDYYISDEKVGYFVVKLHEHRLIIQTFLFLTNNDTFEGEKLNRLLSVEKVDKKYLEIDNLPDFNAYHIDQNEKLSQLFVDAGCKSLLKLGHLKAFTANEVSDKDSESILKYLADAPYFRRQSPVN